MNKKCKGMIPYDNVSYLSHSTSGMFDSYFGSMKMNTHQVMSSINKETICEGAKFLAVALKESIRETTIFHILVSEVERLKGGDVSKECIESCDVCENDGDCEGVHLQAARFTKSATFHEEKSLCESCITELETAIEPEDRSLESEIMSQTV